jgi:hypothetical protein
MSFFVSSICKKCRKPYYPVKIQLKYATELEPGSCSKCEKEKTVKEDEDGHTIPRENVFVLS